MALTELFFDTFTDTAGTLLTAHTPDTGLGWTSLVGNVATNAQIGSDGTAVQPFHNLTGDNYYTANTAQAETLHQRIEVIHGSTAVTRVCLRLRNGSTAADGIFIEFSSAINRVKIFSVTNAVATEIAASFSALTVPAGATCIATITASNAVTASVNGTSVDWASGVTEFTVNGHDAGKFGWLGRKSYTTGGIDSFKGFYDVAAGGPETVTSTIAASIPKPTLSASIAVESSTLTSIIAASIPKPTLSASITVTNPAADPIFTSGILHDNTKTPLANTTLLHATLYDPSTGALVLRVNSPTTNAQGQVVIQNAALSAATDYDFNCETVDGQRIMPRGTTA